MPLRIPAKAPLSHRETQIIALALAVKTANDSHPACARNSLSESRIESARFAHIPCCIPACEGVDFVDGVDGVDRAGYQGRRVGSGGQAQRREQQGIRAQHQRRHPPHQLGVALG